jgi:hypothetical protein
MPLYEQRDDGLRAFTQVKPGPDLFESEIEALAWGDLEAFTGEALFPVARQARIAGGGIPDILALDDSGRVVVIEVKRDVDRAQLAQCLEYAGWARLTNLDEVSELYSISPAHRGAEAFFKDWLDYTETETPLRIVGSPRLYLIARDFEKRTKSALDFLRENGLPVEVVPVSIYVDPQGRRIVDIESDHEPTIAASTTRPGSPEVITVGGKRVTVSDLIDAGLLQADEPVDFIRPRLGHHFTAVIRGDGTFELPDGTVYQSPSLAAIRAADVASYDGWHAWRVSRLGGTKLHELRVQYVSKRSGTP